MDTLEVNHGVICPKCAASATVDAGTQVAESALSSLLDILLHSIFALCTKHHEQQLQSISKALPPLAVTVKL